MKMRYLVSAAMIAIVAPAAAHAQGVSPLSLEARAGAVVPMGDFADGLKTGFGFGATAAYRVIPMLDIYAGYNWHRFGVEDDPEFGDSDFNLDDSGFELGARVYVPVGGSIAPWLQGGLIMQQLKFGASEGGLSASVSTDREIGFEVGGGIGIPIGPNMSLTPGVRYRQYSPSMTLLGETESFDVQYLVADIGFQFRF